LCGPNDACDAGINRRQPKCRDLPAHREKHQTHASVGKPILGSFHWTHWRPP
jgi:hypothetical protein